MDPADQDWFGFPPAAEIFDNLSRLRQADGVRKLDGDITDTFDQIAFWSQRIIVTYTIEIKVWSQTSVAQEKYRNKNILRFIQPLKQFMFTDFV